MEANLGSFTDIFLTHCRLKTKMGSSPLLWERKSILGLQENGSLFQEVRGRCNKGPGENKLFSNREKGSKVSWGRWKMQLSQLQNL